MAGKAGRSGVHNRLPTRLKLLKGTLEPGRLNLNEPQPEIKLPKPPEELGPKGRQEWRRVGRQLLTLGIVSELDRPALALYCKAWERWSEAEAQLKEFGIMLIRNEFPVQSPYLKIATEAMVQMRALLIEFGMTPASRSRVSGKTPKADDPFSAYEGQG